MSNDITDHPKGISQSGARFKIKHILIVFLLSYVFTIIGAFGKIYSWPSGSMIITIGIYVRILSVIVLAVKLLTMVNLKTLLNR
jgi:hypothetical protein